MGYYNTTSASFAGTCESVIPKPHTRDFPVSVLGFRFYSTKLSRWLSRDPIGEWGGWNLYEFVGNDCISRTDPFGLRFGCSGWDPWEKYGDPWTESKAYAWGPPNGEQTFTCYHVTYQKYRRKGAKLDNKGCCVDTSDEKTEIEKKTKVGGPYAEGSANGEGLQAMNQYCATHHPIK